MPRASISIQPEFCGIAAFRSSMKLFFQRIARGVEIPTASDHPIISLAAFMRSALL
jgi:hypothetical protein